MHFQTGRYSKSLPTKLAAAYRAGEQDADLQRLADNIRVHDAMIHSVMQEMEQGAAGELWAKLQEERTALFAAQAMGDTVEQTQHLNRILSLIDKGYKDYMARIELRQLNLERAKLTDLEGRRLERAQQTITVDRLLLIMGALGALVYENVRDPGERLAIAAGIERFAGATLPAGSGANGQDQE